MNDPFCVFVQFFQIAKKTLTEAAPTMIYDVETGNRRSLTVVRFTRSVYQLYLTLIDIFRKIMRL